MGVHDGPEYAGDDLFHGTETKTFRSQWLPTIDRSIDSRPGPFTMGLAGGRGSGQAGWSIAGATRWYAIDQGGIIVQI